MKYLFTLILFLATIQLAAQDSTRFRCNAIISGGLINEKITLTGLSGRLGCIGVSYGFGNDWMKDKSSSLYSPAIPVEKINKYYESWETLDLAFYFDIPESETAIFATIGAGQHTDSYYAVSLLDGSEYFVRKTDKIYQLSWGFGMMLYTRDFLAIMGRYNNITGFNVGLGIKWDVYFIKNKQPE